jgi:L-alanine-DL-glutamate epimerase-like enolase superfamily enzyme
MHTSRVSGVTYKIFRITCGKDGSIYVHSLNRGIQWRTPEGFAAHARGAIADGFSAVKIAPFDDVALYGDTGRMIDTVLLDAGLARIAAVREAIGPDADLMVDCHWRLHRAAAEAVLRATEPLRMYWLECPVPEAPEMLETIRLHICAVAPNFERLEIQYAETPLFDQLVGGALPQAVNGKIAVPRVPGLGVRLDPGLVCDLSDTSGPSRPA